MTAGTTFVDHLARCCADYDALGLSVSVRGHFVELCTTDDVAVLLVPSLSAMAADGRRKEAQREPSGGSGSCGHNGARGAGFPDGWVDLVLRGRARKEETPPTQKVVGYMLMSVVPLGDVFEVGGLMLAKAEALGFVWDGLYLHHSTSDDTIAAIERRAGLDEDIAAVMVPSAEHRPRGRTQIDTSRGPIPVLFADEDTATTESTTS